MRALRPILSNTAFLTVVAMIAFAANSLLCRMALGQHSIDAASFTSVRILAGALTLTLLMILRGHKQMFGVPDGRGILSLFCYMIFFSFAYITLSAGTGALLLFGAVQLTMFTVAIRSGERFSLASWIGLVIAFSGLVYLVAPGVTAPDPLGAILMVIAGISWGLYSLIGRGAKNPLLATSGNFAYSVPLAVAASLVFVDDFEVSMPGVILAVASGALASGLGYAVWYVALQDLTASRAATVQLSVPVIASSGGVLFLSEQISLRLGIASLLTIGGIWLVLAQRAQQNKS